MYYTSPNSNILTVNEKQIVKKPKQSIFEKAIQIINKNIIVIADRRSNKASSGIAKKLTRTLKIGDKHEICCRIESCGKSIIGGTG